MNFAESGTTLASMATDIPVKRMSSTHCSPSTHQLTVCASLENLLVRYEEPSSMVRWDSPLFTVLWTEGNPPAHQIWDAVTKGNVKPPNSGTLAVRSKLHS